MVGRELTDQFPQEGGYQHPQYCPWRSGDWVVYHPLILRQEGGGPCFHSCEQREVVGICGLMGGQDVRAGLSIFGKSYGTNISGQLLLREKKSI